MSRPISPRAGIPLAGQYERLATRDGQFGARMRAWRQEQQLTQDGLTELLRLHTDYQPDSKTTISRLESGRAWPNLWIVEAMARLDAVIEGAGGRGLVYWGYGYPTDPYRSARPAPPLAPDVIPERRKDPLRASKRRAR